MLAEALRGVIYNPSEILQSHETPLIVNDRRWKQIYTATAIPPVKMYFHAGKNQITHSPFSPSFTHDIFLHIAPERVYLEFRRKIPNRRSSHVLLDKNGAKIPTRKKIHELGFSQGASLELAIARRIGKHMLALERYIFVSEYALVASEEQEELYMRKIS